MKNVSWLITVFFLAVILIGCSPIEAEKESSSPNTTEDEGGGAGESATPDILEQTDQFHHIHGLSFHPTDENKFFIASHQGVVLYDLLSREAFYVGESRDDYMGFKQVADTNMFISSGHPGVDSDLPDPLGFMWSEDLGQSWEYRSYLGEVDFHALAASYQNNQHIIGFALDYSKGGHDGLILESLDGGYTWEEIKDTGLPLDDHQVLDISFSPESEEVIYAATVNGLMKSIDGGRSFQIVHDSIVTAVQVIDNATVFFYDEDEKNLVYMKQEDVRTIPVEENQVPINYIALQVKNSIETMIVSTVESSIYLSTNGGESWSEIVRSGTID